MNLLRFWGVIGGLAPHRLYKSPTSTKPTIPETWQGCSEEELLFYLATFLRHCGIQGEPENYLYVFKKELGDILALTPEEAIAWLPYLEEV